jgi:menaquinone-specific isochorismate synthase
MVTSNETDGTGAVARPAAGTGNPRPSPASSDAIGGEPNGHVAHLDDVVARAARLRAMTIELAPEALPDLVRAGGVPGRTLWRKNDLVLLGVGEALRLRLPAGWSAPEHTRLVGEALQAIASHGPGDQWPGRGPLALGALPYDPARGGYLSVPRLVVGLPLGGTTAVPWVTRVELGEAVTASATLADEGRSIEEEVRRLSQEDLAAELPDGFELSARMPHGEWKELVRRAVTEMENGHFAKVVLSRRVDVVANRPFVVPDTLARLASLYPSCAIFHVDGFIGASPETLVRRTGKDLVSHPLAGTVARSGDDHTDAALVAGLMASAKDRREHGLVVDAIAAQLGPLCASLDVPVEPSVLALRNVSHLGTVITGVLADTGAGAPTALELAALLQPTPAVGGHPTEEAVRWQRENEGFERGCYAGPVGWVDSRGDGEWALGLRSATVSGCHAALYAGNGIVVGSDPDAELAETQLKLQALLAALVRP